MGTDYTEMMWMIQQLQEGDLQVRTSGQGTWNISRREGDEWVPIRVAIDLGSLAHLLHQGNYWSYQQYGVYDGFYRSREERKEEEHGTFLG